MYSEDYAAIYNVNKFTLIIVNMRLDESKNECYKHHSGNLSYFRFDCTETTLSFFILLRRINGKT